MTTNLDRRSQRRDRALDRVFSAQDRINGNVRVAVADGVGKVPGVQRVGGMLHRLTVHQLFSRV